MIVLVYIVYTCTSTYLYFSINYYIIFVPESYYVIITIIVPLYAHRANTRNVEKKIYIYNKNTYLHRRKPNPIAYVYTILFYYSHSRVS